MTASLATAIILSISQRFKQIVNKEIKKIENNFRSWPMNLLLSTISPTSVESERAFSMAGCYSTKIRSSLGNDT